MRTIRTVTLAVFAILIATAPAHADINALITFDNLVGNQGPIPDGYMGLHWLNFDFANGALLNPGDPNMVGYANGVVSHPNIAYNNMGQDALLFTDPGNTFLFNSAYFTSTAYWLPTSYVNVTGYLNGNQVNTAHLAITDQSPTLENFGWTVDSILISTSTPTAQGFDVAIDNMQLGDPSIPAPVPEPGAVFLLGAVGAAMLPLVRRRFRRS